MISIWKPVAGAAFASVVAVVAIVGAGGDRERATPAVDQPLLERLAGEDNGPKLATAQVQTLDSLAGILDREVEERLRLEEELASLRQRLAGLERQLGVNDRAPPDADAIRSAAGGGTRGEVTEATFVAAGFGESDAAYYRRRIDEAAMARLYLRDQAEREGWLNSERYRRELAAMPNVGQELRREMDDETYARYLYAVGQPNQVSVQRVLAGSAAEAAGIEPGDVLLRYNGDRIYDTRTVRRSTRIGSAGQTVAVEILRDGRRIQAYLPRGPIGVRMSSQSVVPQGDRP